MPLTTRVLELAGALASVIFPAPCRICGASAGERQPHPLLSNLPRLPGPLCGSDLPALRPAIGLSKWSTESGAQPLCGICRRGLYDFDFARSSALLHAGCSDAPSSC